MRFLSAQMRSRSTPVDQNALRGVQTNYIPLVQFYLYQIDIFDYVRHAQMRSRSTPVGPNRRRQLKVLVLHTEIDFETFLEAILICVKWTFWQPAFGPF